MFTAHLSSDTELIHNLQGWWILPSFFGYLVQSRIILRDTDAIDHYLAALFSWRLVMLVADHGVLRGICHSFL